MKKITLLMAVAMLFALASCQKEKANNAKTEDKSVSAPVTGSKLKVNSTPAPNFSELILQPRQAGENFDTYTANWNGVPIKVTGSIIYDAAKYPTLANGVPVYANSMSTTDGHSYIENQVSGKDYSVFAATQTYFLITLSTYHADLNRYYEAMKAFDKNQTSVVPYIFDFIKTSYTSSGDGGVKTYTGKLIRITTGSHLAVADINYPLPTAATPTIVSTNIYVQDPADTHVSYELHGVNGTISAGYQGYDGGYGSTQMTVSGAYKQVTPNSGLFHSWGTIWRADGTFFNFDQTADSN